MDFTLSHSTLVRLCKVNSFRIDRSLMTFFGLRGCLPVFPDVQSFKASHKCRVEDVNYQNPRCTLGQWLPQKETIALHPGSTVPHIKYVRTSVAHDGADANQLMTGFYVDYEKGIHKEGGATAHQAFRQTRVHPVRRTSDDFDYDNDDRVEYKNPYDNIHAAWCMGVNQSNFASAGCQVVLGYPQCLQRGSQPDCGAWKSFKETAYSLSQETFPYVLLTGRDVEAATSQKKIGARVRFGSTGDLVKRVQQALQGAHLYLGPVHGNFDEGTLQAVLAFQEKTFGNQAEDGIVGPITADALGIEWPRF